MKAAREGVDAAWPSPPATVPRGLRARLDRAVGWRTGLRILFLLPVAVLSLLGCQPTVPGPTPTATRTPVLPTTTPTLTPTVTPTPTATPTLTPSPTLPPELLVPPVAAVTDVCPPLPADLYFLRDGQLWICAAEGGAPQAVTVPDSAKSQRVIAYTVAADGRYVAYTTSAGEAFLFDRALWTHTLLPTAGRLVNQSGVYTALTADGARFIYLAWDVQPTLSSAQREQGSGTVLMIDVGNPTARERELGFCKGIDGQPCLGFMLAPDDSAIAFADSGGIWWRGLEGGEEPRLLGHADDAVVRVRAWAPDAQSLLAELNPIADPALVVLSVHATDAAIAASPVCVAPCTLATAWDAGGTLWLAWDTPAQGCVASATVETSGDAVGAVGIGPSVCDMLGSQLHPRSLFDAANVGLAFLQSEGTLTYAGLYTLPSDGGTPQAVALLPSADGTALWLPSGEAFLYLDADAGAEYLGVLKDERLWDVHSLLDKAYSFTWGRSVSDDSES